MPRKEHRETLTGKRAREKGFGQEPDGAPKWPVPPPDVSREEIELIDKTIEEAFEQIEPFSCGESSPTTLIVETTAHELCPVEFLGNTGDIVYFISMAHTERYGADHPLAKAAAVLKRRLRVNMAPLLKFADARTESAEEEQMLESLWQDAAPLAEASRTVAEAIEGTPELRELTAAFPELPERLKELAGIAAWAAERGAKVRLTYVI